MFDIENMQKQVLYSAVKLQSDDETAEKVVFGKKDDASQEGPGWVKASMARLEKQFDAACVRKIRMNCQCGYGMEEKLALLQKLIFASSDLFEFANLKEAKEAGLSCVGKEIYLEFTSCPCPMLAQVDRLNANTWCLCTVGYSKMLFEKAFGCTAEISLEKSIKTGDAVCLQKISLADVDWERIKKRLQQTV